MSNEFNLVIGNWILEFVMCYQLGCLKFPCKIPPDLPLPKGGDNHFPLWKRGIKGDFIITPLIY